MPWGFDFGPSVGFLSSALSSIIAAIRAVFVFLWNVLVFLFNYLIAVIAWVYQFFLTLIRDIKRLYDRVWNGIVKGALTKLVNAYIRLRTLLAPIVNRVLAWIEKARRLYDLYYRRFVRPYLEMIQKIRQTLQIFRLLGFEWADKLDARLADLEHKIIRAFDALRIPLNQVTTWIQLIADPSGIFRRNPLIGAVLRSVPELQNALDRATQRPLTSAEKERAARSKQYPDPKAGKGRMALYKQRKLTPDQAVERDAFVALRKARVERYRG